jgi:hypothetical protein
MRSVACGASQPTEVSRTLAEPALAPCWDGPINVRALIADLPPHQRAVLTALLQTDKNNYALLLNFAIRVNGQRHEQQIKDETSFALRRPISETTANVLFASLVESDWVRRTVDSR